MTTANITVELPVLEATQSAEVVAITPVTITTDMAILKALDNKNNSLVIIVNATTAGTLKLIAGDNYPNAVLGDLSIACATGYTAIRLEDIARFENRDGSVKVAGDGILAGTIFATAKRAGLDEVTA